MEAGAALVPPKLNAKTEVQVDVQVTAMKMATIRDVLVMVLYYLASYYVIPFFNNK